MDVLRFFNGVGYGYGDNKQGGSGLAMPVGLGAARPIVPRAGALFHLLCNALRGTGGKIVYCMPYLELVDGGWVCEAESVCGGEEGASNVGGGIVPKGVGDDGTDGGSGGGVGDDGTGGEGDTLVGETNTRADGRGRARNRMSAKQKGKQSIRASHDGDRGDRMEIDE